MKIDCLNILDELVQFELPKDGKLTPQLRWVLMNGHCHSFALAIRHLTGWPLVAKITDANIDHLLCQMPVGKLVDAEAATEYPKELFESPSSPGSRRLHSGYEFLPKDGWLKSVEDALIPFARRRLEELEQQGGDKFQPSEYPFGEKSVIQPAPRMSIKQYPRKPFHGAWRVS